MTEGRENQSQDEYRLTQVIDEQIRAFSQEKDLTFLQQSVKKIFPALRRNCIEKGICFPLAGLVIALFQNEKDEAAQKLVDQLNSPSGLTQKLLESKDDPMRASQILSQIYVQRFIDAKKCSVPPPIQNDVQTCLQHSIRLNAELMRVYPMSACLEKIA